MSASLELYGLAGDRTMLDLSAAPAAALGGLAVGEGDPPMLGWVSASDADEELLFGLLQALEAHGGPDASYQGYGTIVASETVAVGVVAMGLTRPASLDEVTAGSGTDAERVTLTAWAYVIGEAALAASVSGMGMGWQMRYDAGASADDAADDFPTAWSHTAAHLSRTARWEASGP